MCLNFNVVQLDFPGPLSTFGILLQLKIFFFLFKTAFHPLMPNMLPVFPFWETAN